MAELQIDMHKDEGVLEVVLCYPKQSRGKRGVWTKVELIYSPGHILYGLQILEDHWKM